MEPQPTEDKSQRSSAALKGTCTNEALSGIRASTPHTGDIWRGTVDAHVPKMSRQPALTDSCYSPSLGAASTQLTPAPTAMFLCVTFCGASPTTCICSPISALTSGSSEWENKLWSWFCSPGSGQPAPPRRARLICSFPVARALHAASALGVSLGLSGGAELTRGRVAPTVTDGRVLSALLKRARAVPGSQQSWQDF